MRDSARHLILSARAAAAFAIIYVLGYLLIGCGWKGLAAGYHTLVTVRDAGNSADRAVAGWLRGEIGKCVKAHGSKTPGYDACYKPKRARVKAWQVARDAISAANELAFGGLQAYHAYLQGRDGGKKLDWIAVVRPAVCAAFRALEALRDILPAADKILAPLRLIKGVACGRI